MYVNQQLTYILTSQDFLLGPLYFFLILFLAFQWQKRYYRNFPARIYIFPALIMKLFACVLLALVFHFYYGLGDSFNYYTGAHEIWNAFTNNPGSAFELIFKPLSECSPKALSFTGHMSYTGWSDATVYMFKISGFTGLFCFGSYLPIALIFTTLSFIGLWNIFKVFYAEFPRYHKWIAIGCLFAPSALFWSTNIFKDPLCMFGLGLVVQALYGFSKGKTSFWKILGLVGGSLILYMLKSYLFYIVIVSALVAGWIYLGFGYKSRNVQVTVKLVTIALVIGFFIWFFNNPQVFADYYSTTFQKQTELMQNVTSQVNSSEDGSGYTIPNVDDLSSWGMLRSFLLSVNVALFRPYFWECNNIMMILNALEVFALSVLMIWVLIRTRVIYFFKAASLSPLLGFAIVFTLLLAPLVGFISFNFGTLVRYKVPFIPFFYTYLFIMLKMPLSKKDKEGSGPVIHPGQT